MPSHVRWFFWLSVALVAYWICVPLAYVLFGHLDAIVAKLPAPERDIARRASIELFAVSTAVWSALFLGLAWLAAFRRQNWARWSFAGLYFARHLIAFAVAFRYHLLDHKLHSYFSAENWTDPWSYVPAVLALSAIALVFTGDARDWFVRHAPAPA